MSSRKDTRRFLISFVLILSALGVMALVVIQQARSRYAEQWLARVQNPTAPNLTPIRQTAAGRPEVWLLGDSRMADWKLPEFPGWCVVNAGLGGITSAELSLAIDPMLGSQKPAVAVVQVGINDLKILGVRPELRELLVSQCVRNVMGVVDRLEHRGSRVIVLPIWPSGPVGFTRRLVWGPEIGAAVLDCNRQLEKALQGRPNVQILDLLATAPAGGTGAPDDSLYRDTLHFTPAAYTRFSLKLIASLEPWLRDLRP